MHPETIAALFSGLVGLIGTIGGITARRDKRMKEDHKELRKEVSKLRRFVREISEYTFRLEIEVTKLGGTMPGKAPDLDDIYEDDEDDDKIKEKVR